MMFDGLPGILMSQPLPLKLWLLWLGTMNLLVPIVFIRNIEARVIIGVFLANALFMNFLLVWMGYGPHLGLSHVIFWTPLMFWLVTRLDRLMPHRTLLIYVFGLIVTNGISLGIDYVDVATNLHRLGLP